MVAVRDGHHLAERRRDREALRAGGLGHSTLAGVRVVVDVAPVGATAPVASNLALIAEVVDDGDVGQEVVALVVAQEAADIEQAVDRNVERQLAAMLDATDNHARAKLGLEAIARTVVRLAPGGRVDLQEVAAQDCVS